MIPYEELVAALSRWRARRGLPTGLGDYLGEPPAPEPEAALDHGHDVVQLDDELIDHVEEVGPRDYAYGRPQYEDRSVQGYREEHGQVEVDELLDYHQPLQDEATRPAGLAGITHPGGEAEPVETDSGQPEGERPVARGRSRNRRRKK
jgi:hypothetical protein